MGMDQMKCRIHSCDRLRQYHSVIVVNGHRLYLCHECHECAAMVIDMLNTEIGVSFEFGVESLRGEKDEKTNT